VSLLKTERLEAYYGDFQALFGVDFEVGEGETVALIGANGAGKSTLLRTVCGLLGSMRGSVSFMGETVAGLRPEAIARRGIAMVPEGRRLFPSLSVEENLRMGAHSRRAGPWTLDKVYALFPMLAERRAAPATSLSGGQQQIVAIGRALLANPRLLLCDEMSLGLAPIVVKSIYDALPAITAGGLALVLVEQDVSLARSVSSRLYCLREGKVTLSGTSASFPREEISKAYFG